MPTEMIPWKELWPRSKQLRERYDKLRTVFSKFYEMCQWLADPSKSPVGGLAFVADLSNDRFTVRFCGKAFRFQFSMVTQDTGHKGKVSCTEVFEDEDQSPLERGVFTFTGNAQTDLKTVEDGDTITIDNDNAAGYAVMLFVYNGTVTSLSLP
jgi:hypothetical protein